MSTIKVNKLEHTSTTDGGIQLDNAGHVTVDGQQMPTAGALSNRNLIINGAMQVSQRETSSDVNSEDKFTLDRFRTEYSAGTFECTVTQESDGPQGFNKSLKVACDTTYTPLTSDNFGITTHLEGQDLQSLGFGSAGAKDLTLSFYVKGTAKQYSCALNFVDSSSNKYIQTRSFNVTSSWQRVVLTFEGNGAALNTAIKDSENLGLEIQWWLAAGPDDIFAEDTTWVANSSPTFHAVTGQENFFDNTSNEFYITGVQLEVGKKATPFEHKSYGDELARCQRYFQKYREPRLRGTGGGSTNLNRFGMTLPVTMRQAPTLTSTGTFAWYDGTGIGTINTFTTSYMFPDSIELDSANSVSQPNAMTGTTAASRALTVYNSNNVYSGEILLNAEL